MNFNFLDYYNKNIFPVIQSIDIITKSNEKNIDIKHISTLLDLSENEIKYILNSKSYNNINSDNIATIMLNGSSFVCGIFRKTMNIGCPKFYTAYDIAYIYSFKYQYIKSIFESLNITYLEETDLHNVFKLINYKAFPQQLSQKSLCQI